MDKMCYIYHVKNVITGQLYIGSSQTFPSKRWAEHVIALRNGKHRNAIFQLAWSNHPTLTDWEFKIRECVNRSMSSSKLQEVEAKHILLTPSEFRLNTPNRTTTTYERRTEIIRRIQLGQTYEKISYDVGLSPTMVCKIKQKTFGLVHRKRHENQL